MSCRKKRPRFRTAFFHRRKRLGVTHRIGQRLWQTTKCPPFFTVVKPRRICETELGAPGMVVKITQPAVHHRTASLSEKRRDAESGADRMRQGAPIRASS